MANSHDNFKEIRNAVELEMTESHRKNGKIFRVQEN